MSGKRRGGLTRDIDQWKGRGESYKEADGPGLKHDPRLKQRCNVGERIHDGDYPLPGCREVRFKGAALDKRALPTKTVLLCCSRPPVAVYLPKIIFRQRRLKPEEADDQRLWLWLCL